MRQTLLVLALLVIVPPAIAQPPPGGGVPQMTPIDELTISPDQAEVIEATPGGQLTLSYTLTNTGSAPLNLTLLGGGRGGSGGAGGFDGTRAPPDGRAPPPGGTPPPGGPGGGFPGGGFARSVNATLVGEPNLTLESGESRPVTYDVRVASDAQPGDSPVMLLAREREGNRTATYTTTIRVLAPASQDGTSVEPAPSDGDREAGSPDVNQGDAQAATPGLGALATAAGIGSAVLLARRTR